MENVEFDHGINGEDIVIDLGTAEIMGGQLDIDDFFDEEMLITDEKINEILKKLKDI